jgi:hypothetical protein
MDRWHADTDYTSLERTLDGSVAGKARVEVFTTA